MVRPTQFLLPQREPATPRQAATLLLLRDSAHGLEVLMTRRSQDASFAPGAYVFPGGTVDAADADSASHAQSRRRLTQSEGQLTQAITALRESFEELGVLLARYADGSTPCSADIARLNRQAPLAAQCRERGLVLAADELYLLAHWVADRHLPKRFDVPFFVARMPEGQQPVADEIEQFEPVWVRPGDALARHEAGRFWMIFPTLRTLERLQAFATVEAVLAACTGEQALWTCCPRSGLLKGKETRFMAHEPPFGELALTSPDGQLVHALDWQSEAPVRLLNNLQRLTAPNPGMMTGPGTNSYLVGDARTGFIVIDPGPAHAAHLQRLHQAAGGDIRFIVCTHSHPDHAPGAQPLQALCATRPPILGLPSAATARPDSHFSPDRTLSHHERLTLSGPGAQADKPDAAGDPAQAAQTAQTAHSDHADSPRHTLQVIHTPGHAANHLCLVLLEDGLLFSGDHILNGSTTVVSPPDGNMSAYLDSLDALSAACAEHRINFILPAHGHAMDDASGAIARLKAHRLQREAKIIAVMQAHPTGTLDDWLTLAYDDVSPALHPVARRSLMAHVERVQALGLAV